MRYISADTLYKGKIEDLRRLAMYLGVPVGTKNRWQLACAIARHLKRTTTRLSARGQTAPSDDGEPPPRQ
jgi:hypothetical protein